MTVTEESGWAWNFGSLPLDDGYGHSYSYRVREEGVAGYYNVVDGYSIRNVKIPEIPKNPPFEKKTEEELEELIDLPEYGTPLYGRLLGTGDETPLYPYVFAGVGAVLVLILVVFGRKRRQDGRA